MRIVNWELLKENTTVNKNIYAKQKRSNGQGQLILLYDNALPHAANIVKAALQELDSEVLLHSPYSPDIAPTIIHLFQSLSNEMRGLTFDKDKDLEKWITKFFDSRPGDFCRRGFDKLVERWKQVAYNEGEYVIN